MYEVQGPPFVMGAGDTVQQSPHIRHRVLESSPGLEVLEVTSPAEHPTIVDHDVTLPTADTRADREFAGQRHDADLKLWYVEHGGATLHCSDNATRLSPSDAIAVPAGVDHSLSDCTADLRLYEVTVPA